MTKERFFKKPVILVLLACTACLLWGSAFPLVKIGYGLFGISTGDTAAQMLFAGLRFVLAGLISLAFGSICNRRFLYPKKENAGSVVLLGLVATSVQYFFFYIGLAHTSGIKASITQSLNVFLCVIMACFIYKTERFTVGKLAGCIFGFAGVFLINFGSSFNLSFNFTGEGFIMLSAAAYALSSSMVKKYSRRESPLVLSAYQFLAGGAVLCAAGLVFGGRITTWNVKGAAVFLYLGFLSAAAYILWNVLLKYNDVSAVSVYGFFTPVFGVVLSALILGETGQALSVRGICALVLVCVGIFTTNYLGEARKLGKGKGGNL